jgi:hypothetical protein
MMRNPKKMKRITLTVSILVNLVLGAWVSSPAMAEASDPNGVDNLAEPGWGLWFPRSQVAGADFDSGFSNSELGGFLDFEANCASAIGLPNDQIDYWFRLTTSVYRMGTGLVEFGCWQNGQFVHTYRSTAILSSERSVTCLSVQSNVGNGLNVRAESSTSSRILRTVRNGSRVRPSSFPAIVQENEGRNWVHIQSPVAGWVSDDRPASNGNLVLCDR